MAALGSYAHGAEGRPLEGDPHPLVGLRGLSRGPSPYGSRFRSHGPVIIPLTDSIIPALWSTTDGGLHWSGVVVGTPRSLLGWKVAR